MVFKNLCMLVLWTNLASALEGLIITLFMGSGWPMFSENSLMLYQHELQLVPYFVKWQLVID